jgi:hypothetical protein
MRRAAKKERRLCWTERIGWKFYEFVEKTLMHVFENARHSAGQTSLGHSNHKSTEMLRYSKRE